jgi:hypothetical protein
MSLGAYRRPALRHLRLSRGGCRVDPTLRHVDPVLHDMQVRRNIDAVVTEIRREISEACSKAADERNEPPLDEQN